MFFNYFLFTVITIIVIISTVKTIEILDYIKKTSKVVEVLNDKLTYQTETQQLLKKRIVLLEQINSKLFINISIILQDVLEFQKSILHNRRNK